MLSGATAIGIKGAQKGAEMERRAIQGLDQKVAPLAFGGNVFGWTADEATSMSLIDAFVDAGLELIDTADVYSAWVSGHAGGESETMIGKWLARGGRREKIVLATKVGKHPMFRGLGADTIRSAVEASLTRLRTDYIDICYSHYDDPDTPLADTLGAYQALIDAGKIRVIGASNYSGERTREALALAERHGLPKYRVLQPEYNLYERAGYEHEIEPVALEYDLAVMPYYGLASGFLSGKYRTRADLAGRVRGGRVERYMNAKGMRILAALDEVAARHHAALATVALAWLITRPSVTAPIASATSVPQLNELVAAVHLQLTADDIRLLDTASSPAEA